MSYKREPEFNLKTIPQQSRPLPQAELSTWITQHPKICFAILFGSFARGDRAVMPQSDVDIAVYTEEDLTLLDRGAWITDLEMICRRAVDLVWLNPLPAQDPALAFEIMTQGHLLFCRETKRYVAFKTSVILRYLDTAYLREQIATAFERRYIKGR